METIRLSVMVSMVFLQGGRWCSFLQQGFLSCVHRCWTCHSLAVGEVDLLEDGVEVRGRLASVVLVEEDGRASELQAQLLHSLTVIHRQQKTLSAAPSSNRHQHREVLREHRRVWDTPDSEISLQSVISISVKQTFISLIKAVFPASLLQCHVISRNH